MVNSADYGIHEHKKEHRESLNYLAIHGVSCGKTDCIQTNNLLYMNQKIEVLKALYIKAFRT